MNDLVSIIVPVYNAEKFLRDTIKTVLDQTYENWELILVNDCSTDNSVNIINEYNDSRIKLFNQEKNGGAALARNRGIDEATGDYICFLDADDLWEKEKLELQVNFMKKNNYEFIYSSYEFADEMGIPNGKKVFVPDKLSYNDALKNTTIWTSTVMLNLNKLNKEIIKMPNVKSEDSACWWKILKTIDYAYGVNNVLAYYRRSQGTLSSNKVEAIKRIWNLYRNVEKLSLFKSCYCFCYYAFNAIKRRV